VLVDADTALDRAKASGRNRVEHTSIVPTSMTIPQAARFLDVSPSIVKKLIAEGALQTLGIGKSVRLARGTLEEYKHRKHA
jgi:excisionase family DNA binding protein